MLSFLRAHSWKGIKFLLSGGTAAVVNLSVLYFCTEYLHFWYIASAFFAFCAAFLVSFTLQKFWTFRDRSTAVVNHQIALYLCGAAINLSLGTLILFSLVEYTGMHYLFAQILVQGTLACANFFIYQKVIFTGSETPQRAIEYLIALYQRVIDIRPLHLAILALTVVFFVMLPFFDAYARIGVLPQEVPFASYTTGNYYFDRMQEITDGKPFMGNPYFIEHRGSFPPAFFVADWLATIPLLLGAPWIATIHIDFVLWSFIFLFIAYRILRALELSERMSLIGAILTFTQVYVFMVPAVSMQVVFPTFLLFLLAFIQWLHVPERRSAQIFLALSAALAAYAYTYAAQIILVALALTGLYYLLYEERHLFRAYFKMGLMFAATFLPFVIYSLVQIQQPFYFESMRRIGLVSTHIPLLLSFKVALWPLCAALIALILYGIPKLRKLTLTSVALFHTIMGAAIVVVLYSNVITGNDLELAQHVERFVVLWLILFTVYLMGTQRANIRRKINWFPHNVALVVLIITLIIGNIHYAKRYGIQLNVHALHVASAEDVARAREFEAPLQWLRDNVQEPSVIWADPDGRFNGYITIQTPHYVLFNSSGALQLLSGEELEERYLVSHYFDLTRDDLLENYREYAGTGNAEHAHRNFNKNVKICRLFKAESECSEFQTRESMKGAAYFDTLFVRYSEDIQPNISDYLAKYSVSYIVRDASEDSSRFQPEKLPGVIKIYDDGRFSIYQRTP